MSLLLLYLMSMGGSERESLSTHETKLSGMDEQDYSVGVCEGLHFQTNIPGEIKRQKDHKFIEFMMLKQVCAQTHHSITCNYHNSDLSRLVFESKASLFNQ